MPLRADNRWGWAQIGFLTGVIVASALKIAELGDFLNLFSGQRAAKNLIQNAAADPRQPGLAVDMRLSGHRR